MPHSRSSLAAVVVLSTLSGSAVAIAQDRVILFEPYIRQGYPKPDLPGSIREVEITDGGRGWSEVVRVEIPPHSAREPVALADGRKVMWLADDQGTLVLAQYDRTTYRASLVDVGRFSSNAFLVADRALARVFVIEPTRIVAIDERLRPFAITLPGPMTLADAAASDGALVVRRSNTRTGEGDVVVLNTHTAETVRTFPVGSRYSVVHVAISRDAQRLYIAYWIGLQHYVDLYAVPTGELLARAPNANPRFVFHLDESRGVLISDQPDQSYYRRAFQVRDARTLALLHEFGLGLFWQLARLSWAATREAIAVYSHHAISSLFNTGCPSWGPRVTLFDRNTLTAVRQIELQGHCPFLVQLPR